MQKIVINIGDRIEMCHVKSASRRKLSEYKYASMLLDYDGMRQAKISMPIHEGRVVPLELEDEYDLCFFAAAGLYRCRAKVTKRFREGKMYVLLMEFLSMPKKYQRRQYYRLDCMQEVRFRVVSDEEKTLMDFITAAQFEEDAVREAYENKLAEFEREWQKAFLTDISGGGVRLQCVSDVEPGKLVEVSIPLQMEQGIIAFKAMARVVANVKIKNGKKDSELRCEFEDIGREKREQVVKYVFEEQKRRLRKE